MKRLIAMSLCFVMVLCSSMIAFGTESDGGGNLTTIIVKGAENIKAYEDAGIIKKALPAVGDATNLVESLTRGTSIPTSYFNLNNGSKDFSYSMSNYLYSNYRYYPAPDSLASSGYGIYHMFNPDQAQDIRMDFYKDNGSRYSGQDYTIDTETAIGYAMPGSGAMYVKYTSIDKTRISGSGTVY